jgi:DNA-binding Lrp family transcriptional regulator
MQEIPEAVSTALDAIREGKKHYVEIKVIKGRFCVFESTSRWDKAKGRPRKVTNYLGTITETGIFTPGKKRVPKQEDNEPHKQQAELTEIEKTVLVNLSMNARMSMPVLAKRIGKTKRATEGIVKRLEKRFGIRYIAEIDVEKLGYSKYLLFIKFGASSPSNDEIYESLASEPNIQLAMIAIGKYNMIVYFLAEDNSEASSLVYTLESSSKLGKYVSRWYVTPFAESYNFVPLRDEFFNRLKKNVWHRSRDTPRPGPRDITRNEYAVMRELNANGVENFTDIDKKNGFGKGTAQFTYYRLKSKGLIKRITLTMQSVPLKYYSAILMFRTNGIAFSNKRDNLLKDIIEQPPTPLNKYSLVGDISTPTGGIFITPIFNDGDLQAMLENFKKVLSGVYTTELVITKFVVGLLANRRLDNIYTSQYETIVGKNLMQKTRKVNYEETGRQKKHRVVTGFRGERTKSTDSKEGEFSVYSE